MNSFRSETTQLVAALDALSENRLDRKEDMALLIETVMQNDKQQLINDLSFHAKFVVRIYGIMSRIGRGADGYEKLSLEFTSGVELVRSLLHALVQYCPPEQLARMEKTYLQQTQKGLGNLLSLCADLGWFKNWLIDHPEPPVKT